MALYKSCQTTFRVLYPSVETIFDKRYQVVRSCLLFVVRQRATKLVHGIADLKYDARLQCLGLVRLENRRLRSDLIETYKILNENYSINRELFF